MRAIKTRHPNTFMYTINEKRYPYIKTLLFNLECLMASQIARLSILLPDCVLTPEYSHLNGEMLI